MSSNLNPAQFHPHLNAYRDGGMGGDEEHNVVGYVRTSTLRSMPGNTTSEYGVEMYRQRLRQGEGYKDPVIVHYDGQSGYAFVGEGNHRVAAAEAEHISHVPARVVRDRINPRNDDDPGRGRNTSYIGPTDKWSRDGFHYIPSDMHPRNVFPERDVL